MYEAASIGLKVTPFFVILGSDGGVTMATWEDVARACLALPETSEVTGREGHRAWQVRSKGFAWERPLRRKDLAELGDAAPAGPVLAAYVPDEGAKQALIAEEPGVFFTTHHFDGFPLSSVGWRNSTPARFPSSSGRRGHAGLRAASWRSIRCPTERRRCAA